jgi:hypothetical protein
MEEESKTDLDKEREELLIQVRRVMISLNSLNQRPDPAFQVNLDPVPDPDPRFLMTIKKIKLNQIIYFFDKILQFTFPYASIKKVQATGEALRPPKRTSITSKDEIYCFLFFWVIFALLDPIHNTGGIQSGMDR